ncbi:uncharacterized protein BT62DRAFT_1010183 [Guyanagaster necrorhizus]|uniref:Uncharacterized protein n=1 Tax=Guyanagaster necrorhizus TaxID=856835 RepID=A0A9P7VL76_9AGAR|nr:uncharacterized protein BT62DRAFT_1010183 [Guyanagaster necrorhizus MCA 3950]KAG7442585.1 hypothetical protein BT62DRAFT_1010183 [Guyanagaster necrorhizus MCA 3950]
MTRFGYWPADSDRDPAPFNPARLSADCHVFLRVSRERIIRNPFVLGSIDDAYGPMRAILISNRLSQLRIPLSRPEKTQASTKFILDFFTDGSTPKTIHLLPSRPVATGKNPYLVFKFNTRTSQLTFNRPHVVHLDIITVSGTNTKEKVMTWDS